MKFWQALSFSEPDQLLDVAQICEEVGFGGPADAGRITAVSEVE